jgi:hypothetical protein
MRGGCRGGGLFLRSDGRARRGDGAFVKMVTDYAFKKKVSMGDGARASEHRSGRERPPRRERSWLGPACQGNER